MSIVEVKTEDNVIFINDVQIQVRGKKCCREINPYLTSGKMVCLCMIVLKASSCGYFHLQAPRDDSIFFTSLVFLCTLSFPCSSIELISH